MRLILKNLGRIEQADIEIRRLTVFVGENSTNKTWAAYCLWDLVRKHMVCNPSGSNEQVVLIEPKEVEDAIDAAIARAVAGIPKHVEVIGPTSIARQTLVHDIKQTTTFGLSSEDIMRLLHAPPSEERKARARLVVSSDEFREESSIAHIKLHHTNPRVCKVNYSGPGVDTHVDWEWPRELDNTVESFLTLILKNLAYGFMGRSALLTMPAERKALIQTYQLLLSAGGATYGKKPYGQVMTAPGLEPLVSSPSLHFMFWMKMVEAARANLHNPPFLQVALQYLENEILHGSVDYDARSGMTFQRREGGRPMPMASVSSIVRSFAALNIYLRYFTFTNDFIIIDEPEMNAHPEEQVRIAELIAYLVSKGLRIILTTHSPYMLDHLGTLVEASRLKEDSRVRIMGKLGLSDPKSILMPEHLAVYRFGRDGQVKSIFNQETRSIDPSIFSDVGDAETNLFSDVLEAEEQEEEGSRGD